MQIDTLAFIAVALVLGVPVAVWMWLALGWQAVFAAVVEYGQFIALLLSLFIVSGGIFLKGNIEATPRNNTVFLAVGAVLASFVGTTGAAMLLIRPLLNTNAERRYRVHTVLFAIFIVANCGGLLTPLGDPPLFLGFLRGVPFTWTLHLLPEWLFVNAMLLAGYFALDTYYHAQEPTASVRLDRAEIEPLGLRGATNFVWFAVIIAAGAFAPSVDAEATADAAMAASAGVIDRFRALVTQREVPVVVTSDQATAETYTMGLIPDDQAKATDAAVVLADDAASFTITPGSEGISLDTAATAAAATQAAASLQPRSITLNYMTQAPTVSDAQAQTVADQANRWVEQDVTIRTPDGKESFTADAAAKASWITVTSAQGAVPTLSVDSARVSAWVQTQSEEVAEEPVNGERNVNSSGAVVGVKVEAVNGTKVTNIEALSAAIVRALSSGAPYSGAFETEVIEATWKDKTIADGAENLIYQAAPGEKWIDINLSSKTVTAYEGATVVHGPVSIVDGAPATPTVTGTYQIYFKHRMQTMRGENADGSTYVTEDVPWVSYFYSGYAFHGAPWRSSFGYSGSHGCINMPVSEAEWIYNWAATNTVVQSHY